MTFLVAKCEAAMPQARQTFEKRLRPSTSSSSSQALYRSFPPGGEKFTHAAVPRFRKTSRSLRLLACKRTRNAYASLPMLFGQGIRDDYCDSFVDILNLYGRVPEWPKGADCKSVVFDFDGSNPSSPTKSRKHHRKVGAFLICRSVRG